MQTVDIAAIRNRIKVNLATALTTFEIYDYEAKGKRYPAATVSWPADLNPRSTQSGAVDLTIPVLIEVVWLGDESSDQALMDAMEAVVNAIESDRTLNGEADDISCGPFQDITAVPLPDDRVVMRFTIPVEVMA